MILWAGEPSLLYLSVSSEGFGEGCRVIKRQKSGFWSVFCSTGPGKGPNRSVFSLFFHSNLVRFWSDFGHFLSGFLIGGTVNGLAEL